MLRKWLLWSKYSFTIVGDIDLISCPVGLLAFLVPKQIPVLGEYKDSDSEVIKQHLEWCEYAGISLWVSSWWGPGKLTDNTLKNHILKHPDLDEMKIALFYETSGRMSDFKDLSNVESDMRKCIRENYKKTSCDYQWLPVTTSDYLWLPVTTCDYQLV